MARRKIITVGIDAHILTGKFQGSRTWLEEVLRELPHVDRVNRYILFSGNPSVTRRICDAPNILHHRLPETGRVFRLLFYWPFARIRHGLDALATTYVAPPFFGAPRTVIVHDVLFETHPHFFPAAMRWRTRLLVRLSVRMARNVVTISGYTRDALKRVYHVPSERIFLARGGVSTASTNAAPPVEAPYLLFVGRLEPRKNLSLALDALDRLARPNLRLVVVGKADFGAQSDLARLRARSDVTHLQNVDGESLSALYRNATMLVFPSEGEGFGLPVLEMLSCGGDVVCSDATALPEVGGRFARYFDLHSKDPAGALAAAVASVLDDPPARDPEGLAEHLSQFTWRRTAEAFVEAATSAARPAN